MARSIRVTFTHDEAEELLSTVHRVCGAPRNRMACVVICYDDRHVWTWDATSTADSWPFEGQPCLCGAVRFTKQKRKRASGPKADADLGVSGREGSPS